MMAKINLSSTLVNKRFKTLLNTIQRYVVVFGGAGSSKSYSIFSFVPAWLIQGRSILGIRENATNVRKSIYLEVTKAIRRQGLSEYFVINKTEMSVKCKVSNGSMVMTGVRDPESLKSITPLKSDVFDLIIIEEATEIKDEDTFNQIMLRQRGTSTFPKQVYLLFNPINIGHWLYDRFFKPIEDEYNFNTGRECLDFANDDLLIHKSTYLDNIYIAEEEIKTYDDMKDRSLSMWKIYAEGNFGVMGELVYDDNVVYVTTMPDHVSRLPWRLGVDHGFQDFQTFVISKYDVKTQTIYIIDSISKRKSLPKQYADLMIAMMRRYNIPLGQQIYADSSDPTKNELFRQYGLNVRKANKGAGSKFTGLMWLKNTKIVVRNSLVDMKASFETYVWKKKNGVLMDDTEHTGSDLLDALRYSYELDSQNNIAIFGKHVNF